MYIYLHAVFKNVANLKIYLKYLYLLIPHQKETLFDMKTKDVYWIYIFNVAKFLETVFIYIYIYIYMFIYIYKV